MGAGHASTSIGYAVGIKEGMRHLEGEADGKVVAVIGDGAMTGGVAFEAIGQAGGPGHADGGRAQRQTACRSRRTWGALSRYFNRVRLNRSCGTRAAGVEAASRACPAASARPSSGSDPS